MAATSKWEEAATRAMTLGGDARLTLDPKTGLNRYGSAPRPSPVLAYASSTANDIGAAAFARVTTLLEVAGGELGAADYSSALETLRARIRAAYGLSEDAAIIFAPSGTDLEYVALALVSGRGAGNRNLLLGADEVGSGCIHSAYGRYFAESTALGVPTRAGETVPGLEQVEVELVDIPVRDDAGAVRESREIAAAMSRSIDEAGDRHVLAHLVHGSKTGLILPEADELALLQQRHGGRMTFVVDACQARITGAAIRDYLDAGMIVFVTGSKFMGGPPFSGFALVPPALAAAAPPLAPGLATLFRRGEWPPGWPGAERLEASVNTGLWLRLEAALFELERFQALPAGAGEKIILAFHAAVRSEIVDRTPARRIAPYPPGHREDAEIHPIEMRSLSTLDVCALGGGEASFEDAQHWNEALRSHGIRLGQPVRVRPLEDGRWSATLRIGLTMAQIVDRAGDSDTELERLFTGDMARIREALLEVSAAPA